jgi:hypothetical protein
MAERAEAIEAQELQRQAVEHTSGSLKKRQSGRFQL